MTLRKRRFDEFVGRKADIYCTAQRMGRDFMHAIFKTQPIAGLLRYHESWHREHEPGDGMKLD